MNRGFVPGYPLGVNGNACCNDSLEFFPASN